ncbi:uncharacterized protein LOC119187347 [Rhipicephalus microplus]|uniref:uncharacterized protein LOC119187347 n=1 Tax=Rhipicephalus microplus TaxID=6941 RepID=UPI003F6ACFB9
MRHSAPLFTSISECASFCTVKRPQRLSYWRYLWRHSRLQRPPVTNGPALRKRMPVDNQTRTCESVAMVWHLSTRHGKINRGVRPVNEAVGPAFPLVGGDDVYEKSCHFA